MTNIHSNIHHKIILRKISITLKCSLIKLDSQFPFAIHQPGASIDLLTLTMFLYYVNSIIHNLFCLTSLIFLNLNLFTEIIISMNLFFFTFWKRLAIISFNFLTPVYTDENLYDILSHKSPKLSLCSIFKFIDYLHSAVSNLLLISSIEFFFFWERLIEWG